VLRAHILEQLGLRLRLESLDALLVKGAALAMTVYDRPWDREMQDIDVLARPGKSERVVRVLEGMGFIAFRPPGRPLSREALGEVVLQASCGGAPVMVEVHTQLDKLVSRPIDYAGIFARARPAPECPGLLVPAPEDHVLIVALHAATAEFGHAAAFLDLALLFRSGVDHAAMVDRARRWRLGTAMFVTLSALPHASDEDVDEGFVKAFVPGRVRLAMVRRFYRLGQRPVAKATFRLGWPWVLRQAPLRDDLARWCVGLARYAALRIVERLLLLGHG